MRRRRKRRRGRLLLSSVLLLLRIFSPGRVYPLLFRRRRSVCAPGKARLDTSLSIGGGPFQLSPSPKYRCEQGQKGGAGEAEE